MAEIEKISVDSVVYDISDANAVKNIQMNGSTLTKSSGIVNLGTVITDVSNKQDTLVSGTNIKTINNTSLLGSGNIAINADTSDCEKVANKVTSVSSSSTDTQYPSAKCTYENIHPAVGTSIPSGGMISNVAYNLGKKTGNTSFTLANPSDQNIENRYVWTFKTGNSVPTVTWPSQIKHWDAGYPPKLNTYCIYTITVADDVAYVKEVQLPVITAVYNITTTESATQVLYNTSNVSSMEVDGQDVTVATTYQFSTTGEHTIVYELTNGSYLPTSYPPNSSDSGMFRSCTTLKTVILPDTVKVTNHSFRQCSSLQEINLNNLTIIGNYSFADCSQLTGTLELSSLDGSIIADNYQTVGTYAFANTGYSKITNLGKATYFGGDSNGGGCFANMSNLTFIEFPETFKKYDSHILHNCTALRTVVIRAKTPPVRTDSSAKFFGYQPYATAIYVPDDTVDTYKAADGWSMYSSLFRPLSEYDNSACEVKSNKVTSLSSASTDTQYPSAKCVYDIVGDIETLINAL